MALAERLGAGMDEMRGVKISRCRCFLHQVGPLHSGFEILHLASDANVQDLEDPAVRVLVGHGPAMYLGKVNGTHISTVPVEIVDDEAANHSVGDDRRDPEISERVTSGRGFM